MTKIRLQFIHEFRDRHGKVRRYFRRPGYKRIPLPGMPGSTEFMEAYQAALDGVTAPKIRAGADRTKPGTIAALVADYFASGQFTTLRPSTRATYHGIIERFRVEHGDKRVAFIERRHIVMMLDKKAATPSAANNWFRMVRMLMQFAIERGLRKDDPTIAVKTIKVRSHGFHAWSEDEIGAYETYHLPGTRARLAMSLLLYTAQRRSDVIRMGRQHIKNGRLAIRQQKTGVQVDIPLHTALVAILAATPNDHLTFLTTAQGKPFTAAGFGNWFRECCDDAGLAGCASHGLRKAASRRLAEAGCSPHEIMSITGHVTLKEVERYSRDANRRHLADAAIDKIGKGTRSGKPD